MNQESTRLDVVHPAYQRALRKASARLARQGEVDAVAPPGTSRLDVRDGGVLLSALVEIGDPCLVRDARHQGATGHEAALLDRFCDLMVGRPLYESVHHGVLRVEAALRDPDVTPPVPGVVAAENADPIFDLPLRLVATLRRQLGSIDVPPHKRGAWQEPPGRAWAALTRDEQIGKVRAALDDALRVRQLTIAVPDVVDIRDGIRIVIAARESDRSVLGPALIGLERIVQQTVEPRLELQFESLADRNRRERFLAPAQLAMAERRAGAAAERDCEDS